MIVNAQNIVKQSQIVSNADEGIQASPWSWAIDQMGDLKKAQDLASPINENRFELLMHRKGATTPTHL